MSETYNKDAFQEGVKKADELHAAIKSMIEKKFLPGSESKLRRTS